MISQEQAIEIAKKCCGSEFQLYRISHGVSNDARVYGRDVWAPDDAWCVWCSFHPGKMIGLFSSRIIVIHKDTGEILFDDSANDEG